MDFLYTFCVNKYNVLATACQVYCNLQALPTDCDNKVIAGIGS